MVRVGGLQYTCTPNEKAGSRISDMRLRGKSIEADKTYKVAGWAPVAEGVTGEPIWNVVETWLRDRKVVKSREPAQPALVGVKGNFGL
jgi:sulfur-oxidizing protein SoxB